MYNVASFIRGATATGSGTTEAGPNSRILLMTSHDREISADPSGGSYDRCWALMRKNLRGHQKVTKGLVVAAVAEMKQGHTA